MIYVTMTDKFLSGWGHAKNKINKLVFECATRAEAAIIVDNAINRTDQKSISICVNFPYHYNQPQYYTQVKTIKEYPSWYIPGYFKDRKAAI